MSTSLLLAIATAAGIAGGVFLDRWIVEPAQWLVAFFVLLSFVMAARGYPASARWGIVGAFVPLCVLLGNAAEQRARHPPLRAFLEERIGGFALDSSDIERKDVPVEIEGRLMADAASNANGVSLRVAVDRVSAGACLEPVAGGVSLTVGGTLAASDVGEWRAGRTIRTTAVLRRPARYLNAGVADLERMLARRGIALVGSVKSGALVDIVSRGTWLDEAAAVVRASVRRAIDRHVGIRDPQSAAIAVAILIGDRGSLDPLVEQRLQEAGTYHVIAISGGNIAILAALLLAALWTMRIRDGWAAGAAIVVLAGYAFIAGSGPSVIRATVMASIYLALRIIDQRTAPLHAISVTLVAVLMASPLSIADVGLWLTFGATAALVAAASLAPLPASPWLKVPAAMVIASLAAELVLVPIVAFVFQRVTVAGLVVNLVAIPSMAVVQIAAMVTAAADAIGIGAVGNVAGWVTHLGVRGLLDSARLVDVAPWLTWRVPSPNWWLIAAYFMQLFLAMRASSKRWRDCARVSAAVTLLFIALAPQAWARTFGDGRLHLTMFDVGQGDAMLVTFPNGRTMMVDAGGVSLTGEFDIGDRVLGPALRARGVARLDYMAVTHGDPDHIGGAWSLLRDFSPREIWYGTYVNNHPPSMALQSMAAGKRSAWRWLHAGERMDIGGVELRVHHPKAEDWQRQKVRNDDSLVIEMRFGEVSLLLTGDIGREVEQELIASLDLLPTVVLKSPHHGSGTSSSAEFIGKLRPRVVLISCGRGNPYRHPVPHVLARYEAVHAQVLRTDLMGQIELITDGRRITSVAFSDNAKGAKDAKNILQKAGF